MINIEWCDSRNDPPKVEQLAIPFPTTVQEILSILLSEEAKTNLFPNVGIWGTCVSPETVLEEGDRLEIYKNLVRDPKEARRHRAQRKK